MDSKKQCKRCKIEKPLDNFKINQLKCIECNEKIAVFRNRRQNKEMFEESGFNVISNDGLNKLRDAGCSVEHINYDSLLMKNKFGFQYFRIMKANKLLCMVNITFLDGNSKIFHVKRK